MYKTIGILGGNEHSYYLTKVLINNNINVIIFDKSKNCMKYKNTKIILGNWNKKQDLQNFFHKVDLILYASLKVNFKLLFELKKTNKIWINSNILQIIKNRIVTKNFLSYLEIPLTKYYEIDNKQDFILNKNKFNYPIVVKPVNHIYKNVKYSTIDTKKDANNINEAIELIKNNKCFVERYKNCVGEFSIVGYRTTNKKNHVAFWNWNIYINERHVLTQPIYTRNKIREDSTNIFNKIMDFIDCPGVYTIKFFEMDKLRIFVNDIIPGFHSTGMHTLANMTLSQYDYFINIINNKPFAENEKIKNLGCFNVPFSKLKDIKKIINISKLIEFQEYYNTSKKSEKAAHVILPKNPNNQHIFRPFMRILYKR